MAELNMPLPAAAKPLRRLQTSLRPAPASQVAKPLACIIHPKTNQLMAPGSKVWPYFFDQSKFERLFIGPKMDIPNRFEPTTFQHSPTSTPMSVPAASTTLKVVDPKSIKKGPKVKKINQHQDGDQILLKIPEVKNLTIVASHAPEGPGNNKQIEMSTIPISNPPEKPVTMTRRSRNHVDIDVKYAELVQRNTDLRLRGRIDESHIIQASVNVGVMLGWSKIDVLDVVEKLERVVSAERGQRQYSSKMMEVIGEIERFRIKECSSWNDLKQLREKFKGRIYAGIGGSQSSTEARLRAPGLLISLQAAINIAFLRGLELAVAEGEEFHQGIYDGKVVLFFRVPNKACIEEKDYLMQMSQLGTSKSKGQRVAACPGIERAIKQEERRTVLEKFRDQVEGGRGIVKLVTMLFGSSGAPPNAIRERATQSADKYLDDEGVLVLDCIYRKRVGFPILVGDQMDSDEEEEEEEEDRENLEEESDMLKPSLVVKLRYSGGRPSHGY